MAQRMVIHDFTPLPALIGGALIGLSASLLLLSHGRVAGISGLLGGLLEARSPETAYRGWFLAGLVCAGALASKVGGAFFEQNDRSVVMLIAAGLLVGFGTRLGGGCTSGHGVCGLSRLSARSLVATVTFMLAGFVTVYVLRHVLAGAS